MFILFKGDWNFWKKSIIKFALVHPTVDVVNQIVSAAVGTQVFIAALFYSSVSSKAGLFYFC